MIALATIPDKLPPLTVTNVSPAALPVPAQVPLNTCFNVVPCSVGLPTIDNNVFFAEIGSANIPPFCDIISTPLLASPPPNLANALTTSFGFELGDKLRPSVLLSICVIPSPGLILPRASSENCLICCGVNSVIFSGGNIYSINQLKAPNEAPAPSRAAGSLHDLNVFILSVLYESSSPLFIASFVPANLFATLSFVVNSASLIFSFLLIAIAACCSGLDASSIFSSSLNTLNAAVKSTSRYFCV